MCEGEGDRLMTERERKRVNERKREKESKRVRVS